MGFLMTDTDWIHEGANVAEYNSRGYNITFALATIERLTTTQIVLDNGNRYRRDTLTVVGDRYSNVLLPVNDQRVIDARARAELSEVETVVHRMTRGFTGGAEAVLAALDEIERAVAAARNTINGKEQPPCT
jgi:hypothetical protein